MYVGHTCFFRQQSKYILQHYIGDEICANWTVLWRTISVKFSPHCMAIMLTFLYVCILHAMNVLCLLGIVEIKTMQHIDAIN